MVQMLASPSVFECRLQDLQRTCLAWQSWEAAWLWEALLKNEHV